MAGKTDPQILEKWQAVNRMVIFYPEWGYACCGELIREGDKIEEFLVSELDNPRAGADLYYDRHANVTSFFIDGIVEKIQVFERSDKLPDGVLFDIPDTDTRAPIDPETIFDGWVTEGFVLTVKPTVVYPCDESIDM
jgi:hypothetical protein